ncbi:RNA-binding protein [Halobacteriales archaeon SW_8_68_21]|nr:MAG: RNA-binding protein [Halobacteriales archaeon SW_8_68_21]
MSRVRVRGIYATALTARLLDAGHEVVDASPPIRRRFDAAFGTDPPDVRIGTSANRQGVGASGDPDAVEAVRDLLTDAGRDALAWPDPTPPGTVLDGEVTETLGGGAVVRLRVGDGAEEAGAPAGTPEGYLPYGDVDARVETGDPVRVQVRASAAPWTDRRPELSGKLRVGGDLVALEPGSGTRVDVRNDEAARELSGMLDLLGLEPPDGWRAVWRPSAVDADTEALTAGLDSAVDAAEALREATDDDGESGGIDDGDADGPGDASALGVLDDRSRLRDASPAAPNAGVWVWFGRESRFGLDDARRTATATMPGHHRVKAGSLDASAGVDLAEALCDPDPDAAFPFGVVTDAFGPREGDALRIDHGKPDGRLITLGEGTVTDIDADGTVTVEREMTGGGTYDGLGVDREAGDVAETSLKDGRWWYPTTYRGRDGTVRGTYVNVCTPVEVFPDAARYVDLHVDVVKRHTPEPLAEKARSVASALENAL